MTVCLLIRLNAIFNICHLQMHELLRTALLATRKTKAYESLQGSVFGRKGGFRNNRVPYWGPDQKRILVIGGLYWGTLFLVALKPPNKSLTCSSLNMELEEP